MKCISDSMSVWSFFNLIIVVLLVIQLGIFRDKGYDVNNILCMYDAHVCAGGHVYVCVLTHVSVCTRKVRSCGHMSSFSAFHLTLWRRNLLDLAVLAHLQALGHIPAPITSTCPCSGDVQHWKCGTVMYETFKSWWERVTGDGPSGLLAWLCPLATLFPDCTVWLASLLFLPPCLVGMDCISSICDPKSTFLKLLVSDTLSQQMRH